MPSFHGAGGYSPEGITSATYEVDLIAADGRVLTVSLERLLAPIHAPVPGMLGGPFLSPPPEGMVLPMPESEVAGGFRYRLLPGLRIGLRRRWTAGNLESLRCWLAARAEQLAPGRDIRRVEIRRESVTIRLVNGAIRRTSEPSGVRVFELGPRGG